MQPLADIPEDDLRSVQVLLSDIDDTITTEGRLRAPAYAALERLQGSGLRIVPITGRPAGWCDHIARMWPVDGVVGENGAFYLVYDRERRSMRRFSFVDGEQLAANRTRLDALSKKILAEVPGAALASDQPFRLADLAIDFCEDVPSLPRQSIERIVALFEAEGAQAKVSSIHVNGWFGDYDKLTMTREFLTRECALDINNDNRKVLFVGDSPNDEPMFGAFSLSVGVANIRRFADRLLSNPKFVTVASSGDGFVELAERLLAARK
ncbi:MAG: HAD-IIB family hydrolase [Beijerinckiaceae bacterium]